jgi:hypothetical protein
MISVRTILQIPKSDGSLFNAIKLNASAILLLKLAYEFRVASDDIMFIQDVK